MQHKTKVNQLLPLLALLIFISGCQNSTSSADAPMRELILNFFAIVKNATGGEFQMEIGISGVNVVPQDESFAGLWELRDEDGNLRASGEIPQLAQMVGENVLVSWKGELEPGQYELTWGAPNYGGLVKAFSVVNEGGSLRLGDHLREHYTTAYPPVMPR